jgi:anti-sigma regulatory factor (Ser/Thr protein kinase)
MIDLSHTRAALLAEIEAPDPARIPLSDITDSRVATRDAHIHVCGHGRDDLFPLLKLALSERFTAVPRLRLTLDLLMPLRNALGNAYKHGNGCDPAKTVCVEIVLTRKGALIAVTDQGAGFDVALTFRRFREQQSYFANHGRGIRNLHQASSTVTYENGGRTVLLCFRPKEEPEDGSTSSSAFADEPTIAPGESSAGHASHESGSSRREQAHSSLARSQSLITSAATRPKRFTDGAQGLEAAEALPKVLDAQWLQTCLSAELPGFGNHGTRIDSCRVYAPRGRSGDDCGDRYVLQVGNLHGGLAGTRILTGRLHAMEEEAAADFEAATKLRDAKISKRVLIPRPVARLAAEPRLVLYDFDPWMNLWDYLAHRRSQKSLRHSAARIGQALAGLHRSQIVFRDVKPDTVGEGLGAIVARAETTLQTLPSGPACVNRLRVCVQQFHERAASSGQRTPTPIHGAFGWDCIQYGVDGDFYLYRFETCRRSDPGLDLGGFAADLLCFTLANHDEGVYRICQDALLSNYNSNAEHAIGEEDLRFYIALALCQRLRWAKRHPQAHSGRLLEALDAALSDQGVAGAGEAP